MNDSDVGAFEKRARPVPSLRIEEVLAFYPVCKAYKFRCVRVFFLVLLMIYLVLYINWISDQKGTQLEVYAFYISMAVAIALLVSLYCVMARYQPGVSVYVDRLEYPSFYFWKRTLYLDNVFSLERVSFRKEVCALVVGSLKGDLAAFDKQRFAQTADFKELENLLSNVVKKNETPFTLSKTLYVHDSKIQSYSEQIVLIFLLVIPLVLINYVGEVNFYTSLEEGAIVKSVKGGDGFYRLFSTFFLHSGFIHLISNLIGLTFLAESLSRLCDPVRFKILLFLSAFIGSITSLYLSPHEYVIGASGGIFGLFGAYCVVKFTKYLPGLVSQRSNKMVFAIIALQVAIEYFVDGIDSYSHAGGFLAGSLCMALYLYFAKEQSIYKSTMLEKGLAVLLSGAYIWGLATFLAKVYA